MANIFSKTRIKLYKFFREFTAWKYRTFYKMDIGEGTVISRKTHLDTNIYPQGVHIGKDTMITGSVIILTHDACRKKKADTYIGDNCFIGSRSTILPGVHIGNQVVIGTSSVVTKDIPDNSIAAGNPAKVIRTGVKCGKYGFIED